MTANIDSQGGGSRSRLCAHCGAAFEQRYRIGAAHTQRYCSRRCAGLASAKTRREQAAAATCPVCGREFGMIRAAHRYCSATCRRRNRVWRRKRQSLQGGYNHGYDGFWHTYSLCVR